VEKGSSEKFPVKYYSSLTARSVDWLWFPYIPYGKITVVQGDPGDGKTTFVLNIAALLSNGLAMPESQNKTIKSKILYQSAEDGVEDTMKPRLISAGADCDNIAFIDETEMPLTLDNPRLESAILETGAKLLVLDPLQAYLGDNGEMNRADGIRPKLKQLAAIAARTYCAVIVIGHMNKAGNAKGLYRGLGSIDITAAARSVLLIGRIKSNPSIRVMAQLKNSLAKEGPAVAFEINAGSSVRWIGSYDISADELLLGEATLGEDSKIAAAERILSDMLIDGAKPCLQVYSVCDQQDISKRTVDRAKKQMDIKSVRRADGWYWMLGGDRDA